MVKRKRTKRQMMIYKTLHGKPDHSDENRITQMKTRSLRWNQWLSSSIWQTQIFDDRFKYIRGNISAYINFRFCCTTL